MKSIDRPTPLVPHGDVLKSSEMCVQEMMYGHRFTTDQEPYMILLEALMLCAEVPLGTTMSDGVRHEDIAYAPKQRKKMRYLLFFDRHLERISSDSRIPDGKKWEAWKDAVSQDKVWRNNFNKTSERQNNGSDPFGYLDKAFNRDIQSLLQAVRILRSHEIDISNKRRRTSKFLAVKGPDMVCSDVREGDWTRDRRFFARGGELVYLMLNRSHKVHQVRELIESWFLKPDNHINIIAKEISDPSINVDRSTGEGDIGYLPLADHKIYHQMAKDWVKVLTNKKLPNSHIFDPLFRITGLNIVRYFTLQNQKILHEKKPEPIVIDANNGVDVRLRESAKEHLNRHRSIANRAVDVYVRETAESKGWSATLFQKNPDDAYDIIRTTFLNIRQDQEDKFRKGMESSGNDPERLISKLIKDATERSKNNIDKFILPLTKGIGIVTARSSLGTWFSLDDAMITALVLANVVDTVELGDFTWRLYKRYGLVVGPDEASDVFKTLPIDLDSFKRNHSALESRMTRLALTRRLSDDCAFVVNPYR